jgi:signal transduction histidine kinase/ligand-binding sensor domain-containing protein/DNA-binding NarL/FixJ family response regulator
MNLFGGSQIIGFRVSNYPSNTIFTRKPIILNNFVIIQSLSASKMLISQLHPRLLIKRSGKFALLLLFLFPNIFTLSAQKIHKFEQINTDDGLSQNFVQSIYCDNQGFLWFGTWDGLNRYDGRQFKIFKVNPKQRNSLTNNRIIDIWQDKQNILWVKTNDGYIHYLLKKTYEFITYPYYLKSLEERNSTITCFVEDEEGKVLLGSSNSGFYFLTYDTETDSYDERQFLYQNENSISNNSISFILTDDLNDIWIGTKRGINNISEEELRKESPSFSNYWLDYNFSVGHRLDSLLLFGTQGHGIKTYESHIRRFDPYPSVFSELSDKTITIIQTPFPNKLFVGTLNNGLYIYDLKTGILESRILAKQTIRKIYKDSFGTIWINTNEFGIYQLDEKLSAVKHFNLTDDNMMSIVDDERQFIYEDSNSNLWIALHGGGLAHYSRDSKEFEFYRNNPSDNTTISSDNVYCITEDHSGLLWVGTGIPNGGVNKVYTSNSAFQQILLEQNVISGNENVVRSLLTDTKNHLWLGTKSGEIYILDPDYNIVNKFDQIPVVNGKSPGQNAYTIMQDRDGYIWIGTKGGGIFVTEYPVDQTGFNYKNQRFFHYQQIPDQDRSLSSNIIYSIKQDSDHRIWIGSYEGGLNLVLNRNKEQLECLTFNTENSNISTNKVRHIFEDHNKILWITTAFGINYIDLKNIDIQNPDIKSTLFDPRKSNSLSYNDVIHVFEDSKNRLWFSTSGGGVNQLIKNSKDTLSFYHMSTADGLINDVVYAIIEDRDGDLWFSTDHGISKYNPEDSTFENFDQSNNLTTDAFNENTVEINNDGRLLFGTNDGLLIIDPTKIQKNEFMPNVVFTNFQLFNKDIDISDPESPIRQDIETLDKIELKYFQSSFSIEYAALSYYAPTKNKYAFMLENFDEDWNEVGNQNKATYTNLPPGDYIFRVKAANWNSDWSNKTRNMVISILPPWWKTTWAYIMYTIILVVIFESIRRSYVRYHQLQNDLKVEKRVNDIKLQFFTNISHEIRTPLTLILGPIHDLMEIKNIPANISNKLHFIEKNGKRMLRLVNQLLDFRKVQKNKMTLKVHEVELVSFIRSIIENFDLVAKHKHIKITFEPKVETINAWVDPNKFDSVIFNILSNALKFSPDGGKVKITLDSSTGKYIDISISDQGSGIPRNRINLIFERFSPLSEENEEFGSSGIGLAYSYQIMKLHHGDIMVSSELKKGSTFTVRLIKGSEHFSEEEIQYDEGESFYLVKHEKVIEEDLVVSTDDSELLAKKHHILIVEDNPEIMNYLKENLQKNYSIGTALNGKEALLSIHNKQPDILITDIMMPEMNGIELTKHLKNSLETSHIPVIMLTAKSSIENQIEGIESGAEAYILKPFNMAYVQAIIINLIKQRSIIHLKYIQNKDNGFSDLKITTKDEKFLSDITQLILDNYSDPEFNIEKLVESSYVSRTVFYHKIKSLTGLTPIDFLRQKRLHIASQMILETDYNVSEIAVITGFNDVKNFSKRFKEIYKLTPTQYKQEILGQN